MTLLVRAAVLAVGTVLLAASPAYAQPIANAAATCSDYDNQAEAQRAGDTRDADGDGVFCESLPCPCSKPGQGGGKTKPKSKKSCTRPNTVQRITFSRSKYPNIRKHYLSAVGKGWPRILYVNRKGTDDRRDRLMEENEDVFPARSGFDRDEYPPAVGRGRGSRALKRGANPTGWMADLAYVRSRENRSHGSSLGGKLRRLCNGVRFRYAFR